MRYNIHEVKNMDCARTGALIRRLRLEKGLTQAALAMQLNLSAKTISKWETGRGCPDVSLLGALSSALGADLSAMLAGDLCANPLQGGNMKKTRYFVCPVCGSISLSSGNAQVSCCGRTLEALTPVKAAPEEMLQAEIIEDEWFITGDHPMEKDNYIRFVAFQTGDRVEFLRQYPEWNLQLRIKKRGHGMLVWYADDIGLKYRLL